MVLVGVRREGGKDGGVDLAGLGREQRLIAEVHQRLVGVVMQEFLHILGQSDAVIEGFGVLRLVVVKLEQQVEGEILDVLALRRRHALQGALNL